MRTVSPTASEKANLRAPGLGNESPDRPCRQAEWAAGIAGIPPKTNHWHSAPGQGSTRRRDRSTARRTDRHPRNWTDSPWRADCGPRPRPADTASRTAPPHRSCPAHSRCPSGSSDRTGIPARWTTRTKGQGRDGRTRGCWWARAGRSPGADRRAARAARRCPGRSSWRRGRSRSSQGDTAARSWADSRRTAADTDCCPGCIGCSIGSRCCTCCQGHSLRLSGNRSHIGR